MPELVAEKNNEHLIANWKRLCRIMNGLRISYNLQCVFNCFLLIPIISLVFTWIKNYRAKSRFINNPDVKDVSREQLPKLWDIVRELCSKMNIKYEAVNLRIYKSSQDALTYFHNGKYYINLPKQILVLLEENPLSVKVLLAHELCHVYLRDPEATLFALNFWNSNLVTYVLMLLVFIFVILPNEPNFINILVRILQFSLYICFLSSLKQYLEDTETTADMAAVAFASSDELKSLITNSGKQQSLTGVHSFPKKRLKLIDELSRLNSKSISIKEVNVLMGNIAYFSLIIAVLCYFPAIMAHNELFGGIFVISYIIFLLSPGLWVLLRMFVHFFSREKVIS